MKLGPYPMTIILKFADDVVGTQILTSVVDVSVGSSITSVSTTETGASGNDLRDKCGSPSLSGGLHFFKFLLLFFMI